MEGILDTAVNGHNIMILGQAGTGKTVLLRKIRSAIEGKRNVQMTASTGIAAASLNGCTVHRFCGIQDGRYKDREIIEKILNDVDVHKIKKQIENTDCLIIDEISMLSKKTFLQIEAVLRGVRGSGIAFGGMQLILAGDFYQLKPIPNMAYGDEGEMILCCPYLKRLIPHHFILTDVHRQTEASLIRAVHELSQGIHCSQETEILLKKLERPLPPGEDPAKLFALNYNVDKFNSNRFLDTEGEQKVYTCVDDGDVKALARCSVPQRLHLKVGVPIILQTNLSDLHVNGLRGVVVQLMQNSVKVKFDHHENAAEIQPFTFTIYNPNLGKTVACRKQLPIRLAFALTVHKSQGLTFDRVDIDCRNMFYPGQIGVAVGRARSIDGLRVTNFRSSLVRPQPDIIRAYNNSESTEIDESRKCCMQESLPSTEIPPDSNIHINRGDTEDTDSEHYVDSDEEMVQIVDILDKSESELPDIDLPINLELSKLLESIEYKTEYTSQQVELNHQIRLLRAGHDASVSFVKKMYVQLKTLLANTITEENFTNKNFTTFYGAVAQYIGSDNYKQLVQELFLSSHLQPVHFRIAFGIIQQIRGEIIEQCTEIIKTTSIELAKSSGKSFESSEGGRAKIRYIAGWCIATTRHSKKQNVIRHLYSSTARNYIDQLDSQVHMLDSLVESESFLLESSTEKPTLAETQRKDVRGGLCHVTDQAFHWFENMDMVVRRLESQENVNVHGKHFYDFVNETVLSDTDLEAQWVELINASESKLKAELVAKFIRMSSAAFRREFRQKLKVKKREAHRKQIGMVSSSKSKQDSDTTTPSTSATVPKRPRVRIAKKAGKGKRKKSKAIEWPCGLCQEECVVDCVCCDRCDIWYHYQCIGLYGDESELQEDQWFCPKCKAS